MRESSARKARRGAANLLAGRDALHDWRGTSGFEVDAVVGRELAVEIKATEQVTERDVRGLRGCPQAARAGAGATS